MVLYVAHPLGKGLERDRNLNRVENWLGYLLKKHPNDALVLSWPMYAAVLDEHTSRERGMRDDLAILSKCDGILLCGAFISPGMLEELTHYVKLRAERGAPINVYSYVGSEYPPEATDESM